MKETKKQTLVLRDSADPLVTRTVEVEIPRRDKILCTEDYVLQDLNRYDGGAKIDAKALAAAESRLECRLNGIVTPSPDGSMELNVGGKYSYGIRDAKTLATLAERFGVSGAFEIQMSKGNRPVSVAMPEIDINDSIRNAVRTTLMGDVHKYHQWQDGKGEKVTTAYKAVCKTAIGTAGYLVEIDSVECFMPKSQISTTTYPGADVPVGAEVLVIPVNYDARRDSVIVSNKAYADMAAEAMAEQWAEHPDEPKTATVVYRKFNALGLSVGEYGPAVLPVSDMDAETAEAFATQGHGIVGKEIQVCYDTRKGNALLVTQTFAGQKIWASMAGKFFTGMTLKAVACSEVNERGYLTADIGDGKVFSAVSSRRNIVEGQKIMLEVQYFNAAERRIKLKCF